jgi:TPR repeat protein
MRYEDLEFYALIVLFLFTIWFVVNTFRYYYAQKRRIRHLHRFAKEGEKESQLQLAQRYQKGEMVKKSCRNAAFWYQKAAFSGDEKARNYLQNFLEKHRRGDHKNKC